MKLLSRKVRMYRLVDHAIPKQTLLTIVVLGSGNGCIGLVLKIQTIIKC